LSITAMVSGLLIGFGGLFLATALFTGLSGWAVLSSTVFIVAGIYLANKADEFINFLRPLRKEQENVD